MKYTRIIKEDAGSTAVEFSLVAIPALLFIFGAIETSRFLWTYTALQETTAYAARCVGLRAAACSSNQVTVDHVSTRTFITTDAKARGIDLTDSVITIMENTTCEGVSNFSQVTIEHSFQNVFTLFSNESISAAACFPNQS